MLNCHRERFRKLTFRALALRQNFCFDLPHRRSIKVSLELEIHFNSLVHFGLVSTPRHKILVTGLLVPRLKLKEKKNDRYILLMKNASENLKNVIFYD